MHKSFAIVGAIVVAFLTGCTDSDAPPMSPAPTPNPNTFDSANTGTIRGRVIWDGAVPTLPTVVMKANAYHNCLHKKPVTCIPPHQPRVKNGGVAGAVVFLRGIDPRRSKPWDHAPARIEFRDRQMIVKQGDVPCSTAFVQRGAAIEAVNRDADFQALRGRGADVFGLPLITPNESSRRVLTNIGLVELTSGAGYYWQHAHLFVDDHPYYARTNAEGHFVLDQVPAGMYVLVCWMPNWIVTRKEIDPETAIIARLRWAPPVEQRQTIEVRPGAVGATTFHWSRTLFD